MESDTDSFGYFFIETVNPGCFNYNYCNYLRSYDRN